METKAIEYFRLLDAGLGFVLEQLAPDDTSLWFPITVFKARNASLISMISIQQRIIAFNAACNRQVSAQRQLKYLLKRLGLFSLARKATSP